MFILIFLPVYLSIFVVVVFKILVISVSNMDDSEPNLSFEVDNNGGFSWIEGEFFSLKGKEVITFPETVIPGKINDFKS